LDKKTAAAIFLVAVALSMTFVAVASGSNGPSFGLIPQMDSPNRLAFTLPLAVSAGLHNATPLNLPTRIELYTFVKENPGVHFRGICSSLYMPIGTAQYHLNVLEHAELVTVYFDGQNKRYFQTNTFTASEMKIISALRHETTGKILNILNQNGTTNHKDIAQVLGVSSQALTWQMHQLKKANLVDATKNGLTVTYNLTSASQTQIRTLLTLQKPKRFLTQLRKLAGSFSA
jgi:DNA-binding transcriptional ArsR family regulator